MANWTKDAVRDLIEQKINTEKEKLKKSKQPLTSDYLADILADFILAMMSNSRYRELSRLREWLTTAAASTTTTEKPEMLNDYLAERLKATKAMSEALQRFAEEREAQRK